jgi:diaminohydroxyphosphoribosylaminopyrimidine deaminase/5-amino-6-(5-phosphoribosylamino)uracil reductase
VHLKLAASLDGKIATRTGDSKWITGDEARQQVQKLRHEYDAILIGAGTAAKDEPLLTDRSGRPRRLPLTRVVLDENLRLSIDSRLVKTAGEAPLLVLCGSSVERTRIEGLASRGVEVISTGTRDLNSVLEQLGRRGIQSLLVEGGANVAGSFLDAGFVDKVSFFIAPKIIGGCEAPVAVAGKGVDSLAAAYELEDAETKTRGRDVEITGYPRRHSNN